MKLKCPACGAPIPAAAINIQQMVAVCPECDNVFKFGDSFTRRRKLKAPVQFRIVDDDPNRLNMAFAWSWRTEPPVSMIAIIAAFFFVLVTFFAMMIDGAPLGVILMPLLPIGFLGYTLLTIAVNVTHYESDGEMLRVYTEPLPYFRYGSKTIALDEIDRVTVERPSYGVFPEGKDGFYDVYVQMLDGDRRRIAAVVNYEHAHFIAQEIEGYVQAMREAPQRALEQDDALITDDADDVDTLPTAQRKAARS